MMQNEKKGYAFWSSDALRIFRRNHMTKVHEPLDKEDHQVNLYSGLEEEEAWEPMLCALFSQRLASCGSHRVPCCGADLGGKGPKPVRAPTFDDCICVPARSQFNT